MWVSSHMCKNVVRIIMFFFNVLKTLLKNVDRVPNFANPSVLTCHDQCTRVYPKHR